MGLWSRLNAPVFILSLGVGLMLTYMTVPPPTIVIKFPTPFNAGRIVYSGRPKTASEQEEESGAPHVDASDFGECYKYRSEEVDCKDYEGKVRAQPMTLGAAASIGDAVGAEGFGAR